MSQNQSQSVLYTGGRRRLVLAFDLGTTYSGVSYSVLDPGQGPEIKGVMRFPAHGTVSGASKIPTVLYYDEAGAVVAAGAEATKEGIEQIAIDEGWTKAEWFKLHVRSQRGTTLHLEDQLPPLPPNKTIVQVLADYMKYLYECTKLYIQDTHASGESLWASVENDIDYVISHPNGWEGYQQSQIRDAVILAGLAPDSVDGKARITFLTEGEASLHYAIRNGLPAGALNKGEGVIIVDAGGGTIDVSAYRKTPGDRKASFEEIAVPQCHFFGSAFVAIHARIFISQLLAESSFIDDIDSIVQRFDLTTKLQFRSDVEPQYIRFGGNRDNDEEFNIRHGQLKLLGKDVAGFFEPSIQCIVDAVLKQVKGAHNPISHVVLVGGFASNDWLFNQVDERLRSHNLNVTRPDSYVNKAVSDGAISFYLRREVRSRVSKFAYGTFRNVDYDPRNPEHRVREAYVHIGNNGRQRLRDRFSIKMAKNIKIEEGKEYRSSAMYSSILLSDMKFVYSEIWSYRGSDNDPHWKDEDPGMYSKLCRIVMDLSHVPYKTLKRAGTQGVYYQIEYDSILFYQGVELKAQMAWRENGVEKRSEAHVVYYPTD